MGCWTHAKSELIIYHLRQSKFKQWYEIKRLFCLLTFVLLRVFSFFSLSIGMWNKNCSLQNETRRKMPHIALEKASIQMPGNTEIDVHSKNTHTQTTYQKKNIKEEKNVCCFLNIYGRPISTVIILVKNINFMSVSVFRLCIFDHAIIWLHLAIQHVSVPNKCRPSQPNMLLLCNDFVVVVFGFFFIYFFHFYTIFFGIGVIPSSYLLWILELLSILQLKFNERLDYRICGQSSSNPLCFQYRMKLYTFFAMCSDPEPEIHLSVVFWLHFGAFTWTVCVSLCFITNASPINHMATV